MTLQAVAGFLAALLSTIMIVIYIRSVRKNDTRPQIFSWIIWALISGIAGAVGFAGGAYVSAATLGVDFVLCAIVCFCSYSQGDKTITKTEWALFLSALAIVPIWVTTKDAAIAAVLAATIDVIAVSITMLKAWRRPFEENLGAFCLSTSAWVLGLLAVSPYTFVTGVFPTTALVMNTALIVVIILRRAALSRPREA